MIRKGTVVVVAHADDEFIDARMIGRVGVVVGWVLPHDHGASARDPLLEVSFRRAADGRFARDYRDAFWRTELTRAR